MITKTPSTSFPTLTNRGSAWKALQLVVFLLLLANLALRDNKAISRLDSEALKASSLKSSGKTLRNFHQSDEKDMSQDGGNDNLEKDYTYYTQPVADRVPAEGIEAILATSSTDPAFHFFAYTPKKDLVTEQLIRTGVYEKDSTTALIDAIVCRASPDTDKPVLVVDMGANIGFHSLHMASCGVTVISFEASPDTAWLLRSSAALNGYLQPHPIPLLPGEKGKHSLTIIPKGVSNTTSTGRLSRHNRSPGMTSFVKKETSFQLQSGAKGTALDVDIPLVRAQDALQAFQISSKTYHLRFLKVDVEGFEYQALQGLDLEQSPFEYITFEFFPALLRASGTDPAELLVYIWSKGYRYFVFHKASAVENYQPIPTGDTKEAVRTWAQNMVMTGNAAQGDNYHVNLLAKHV